MEATVWATESFHQQARVEVKARCGSGDVVPDSGDLGAGYQQPHLPAVGEVQRSAVAAVAVSGRVRTGARVSLAAG